MSVCVLKTVVFLGSARNIKPPWGSCTRLGDRVLKHTLQVLTDAGRGATVGSTAIQHDVTVYDPLEVFGEGGALFESGAEVRKPSFFYGSDPALPDKTAQMRDTIKGADCLLIVTPEYNHAPPPALLGMLNNFGGSCFGYKPLGIVAYSPSPYGGMRAAVALRPIVAELGAMSVSRLVGFADAEGLFREDGSPTDPSHRMLKQLPNMLAQLEWYAVALKDMRAKVPPP
jgi:NAD(P)H-dependent FMN reductase